MRSIVTCVFLIVFGTLTWAQEINGTFSSSVGQITIDDARLVVTLSAYEFYGHPKTVYSYPYKVTQIDTNHIRLKLRKSKIIDGPKRLVGSGRKWPNSHDPKIDGLYQVKIVGDGVELLNSENSKTIALEKKRT